MSYYKATAGFQIWNFGRFARQMVRSGAIPRPLWYDAMRIAPPPAVPRVPSSRKPKRLVVPEDRLRRILEQRYPELKDEPINLRQRYTMHAVDI